MPSPTRAQRDHAGLSVTMDLPSAPHACGRAHAARTCVRSCPPPIVRGRRRGTILRAFVKQHMPRITSCESRTHRRHASTRTSSSVVRDKPYVCEGWQHTGSAKRGNACVLVTARHNRRWCDKIWSAIDAYACALGGERRRTTGRGSACMLSHAQVLATANV